MLKRKNNFKNVSLEILQHIILLIVAFLVLLPITEVIIAGFRKNQAVFGPHIGLFPLVDTNSWVDVDNADRRENRIKKDILLARFTHAVNGESFESIMDLEVQKKLKADMTGVGLTKQVKDSFKEVVYSNGDDVKFDNFFTLLNEWKQSVSPDFLDNFNKMFYSNFDLSKFKFEYEKRFTFENYIIFFRGTGVPDSPKAKFPMFQWFINSIFIALSVAIIQLVITALAGYALSRFNFTGKKASLMTLLTIQVFPGTMAMVALYLLLLSIGKINPYFGVNSKLGLILIYLGGGIPFNIWMVKGYFDTVPKALEESAMIDGATPWQAFTIIILPLVRPILAVVTILSFVGMYNEYVLAAVILTGQDKYTLPVGLRSFISVQGAMNTRFGIFSAASFVGSLPIVVLWLSLQNQIISGLTGGSVKG